MTDNLRHWNILKKTDPEHTKKFDRAGGFKGTATKPIYLIEKLTGHFGPAGIGWGTTEPRFQVERFGEDVLVFCTIGLWYTEPEAGYTSGAPLRRSEPIYGTGGDNLRLKRSGGFMPNDEAFKAAQTDALSNAMKLIGVLADIHMGLHDDDKYVRELKREFSAEHAAPDSRPKPVETQTLPTIIDGVDIPAILEEAHRAKEIPTLATWINENAGMLGDIGHKTPRAFDALAEQIFRHALSLCKNSGDIATWVGCKARGVVTGKMSAPVFDKMNDLVAALQTKLPKKAA